MGGFIRRVFRTVFSPPAQQPAQVVTTQPAATTTVSGASKMSKVRGQGSGVTGTIMTDATGIEEEANVSKTVLGGTTKKKKKYA
jgi:hypothetical protein